MSADPDAIGAAAAGGGAARFFAPGGTLPPDAPSYIERAADAELRAHLLAGDYCYVLTARQMGKSSLMVRTAAHLRDAGVGVAVLDLNAVGHDLDAERWYYTLLSLLARRLEFQREMCGLWEESAGLSPPQRWIRALEGLLDARPDARVVVFIDEIDQTRALPFSADEFFAAIRSCYNLRAENPAFRRLAYCLLGVASPADLIRDDRLTPFNVGRRVRLNDFTPGEARRFAAGLARRGERDDRLAASLLARVLHWTAGHPYLTQRLCQAIAEQPSVRSRGGVDRLCAAMFLSPEAPLRDDNLAYVQQRLTAAGPAPGAAAAEEDGADDGRSAALTLYRRVLEGRRVPDDETSADVRALKLAGVVRARDRRLAPRNRIYARVFDRRWVRENLPGAEVRRQSQAYWRGVRRAAAAVGLPLAVILALAWVAAAQRTEALRLREESRRAAYGGDVYQAFRQLEDGFLLGTAERLAATVPGPGESDLRGFEWRYLWGQIHAETWNLRGHVKGVYSHALSPDGRVLATGSFDRTICLWDTTSGSFLGRISGLDGAVTALCFSPDGRTLAAGVGLDRAWLGLWEVANGRQLARGALTPVARPTRVVSLVNAPDEGGLLVAVDAVRKGARLYHWRPGRAPEQRPLPARIMFGDGPAFARSPDGRTHLAGGGDLHSPTASTPLLFVGGPRARRWTPLDLPVRRLDSVACVSISPDGAWAAVGMLAGAIFVWRPGDPGRPAATLRQADGMLTHDIAFSPDGAWMAAAGWDGFVRTWTLPGFRPGPILRGHTDRVNGVVFLPKRDGHWRLATTSNDRTVRVWDLDEAARPSTRRALPPGGHRADLTPDAGTFLWLPGPEPGPPAEVWRTDPLRRVRTAPLRGWFVAAAPDGSRVVRRDRAGNFAAVDAGSGKVVADLAGPWDTARFSPDGKWLALAREKQDLVLLEARDFREVARLTDPAQRVNVTFSPDSRRVVTAVNGSTEHHLVMRDLPRLDGARRFAMPGDSPGGIAFSSTGRWLAATDWAGPVALWDVRTGERVALLLGHRGAPIAVAFSRDGRSLVTHGEDGLLKFWDIATRREIGTLRTGLGRLYALGFLPDDRGLVLADLDEVRVLRAPSLEEIAAWERATDLP